MCPIYIIIIAVLAAATIIEAATGTDYVYHSWWFTALWSIFAAGLIWRILKLWKRWTLLGMHTAILLILAGAALTRFTGEEGSIHLRTGIPMTVGNGPLIRLDSFEVKCYPGTQTPADYVSHTNLGTISMNRTLTIDGYRLFQASYDYDLQGSTLAWNHDPLGMPVTYAGYALLCVCLLLWLARRDTRLWVLLMLLGLPAAKSFALSAISANKADSLERTQVIYNGRPAPMGTVAHDFLLKVARQTDYHGLTAMQVMGSWVLSPEEWSQEPLIEVKDSWLRRQMSMEGSKTSLKALFDEEGNYRLASLYAQVQNDKKLTKAVRELDEQVGLILMLTGGTLFEKLEQPMLSEARVSAELLYNRIPATKILFILCFIAVAAYAWLWRTPVPIVLITAMQAAHYALRWYVSGRIPLANGFETMQFLALAALTAGVMTRRYKAALLVAGCTLLVSHLGQMNPQITPLMPVLNSPWLSSHVSCIMTAYALTAFMALQAASQLIKKDTSPFTITTMHRAAVALLAIGIILGAVWANESWGRYWAWDPKEVWALITLMVYALPLHPSILRFKNPRSYHWFMLQAFASVLMTYFGVNYVLGGMHSYANS